MCVPGSLPRPAVDARFDGHPFNGHELRRCRVERFRSGIGTSLLDADAAALAAAGCEEAILWTLEEDQGVIRFYARRGWEPDGARQTVELDQSRAALRLWKSLSQLLAP